MGKYQQSLYKKETCKTKEEWLLAREIGGSDASSILEANPWQSKLDLFKKLVLNQKKEKLVRENQAMIYGTAYESLLRKGFALDFDNLYKIHSPRAYELYRRRDKPYLTATPDGLLTRISDHKKGIWEAKTHDIRGRKDEDLWTNSIPQNYFIQALHYLLVLSDYEFVVVNAQLRFYDYFAEGGKKLLYKKTIYHEIWRKEVAKQLDFLEKEETSFYENNVLQKIIPTQTIKL